MFSEMKEKENGLWAFCGSKKLEKANQSLELKVPCLLAYFVANISSKMAQNESEARKWVRKGPKEWNVKENGESANMSEGKKRREEKRLSLLVTYLSSMVLQFGVQDETLTHDMLWMQRERVRIRFCAEQSYAVNRRLSSPIVCLVSFSFSFFYLFLKRPPFFVYICYYYYYYKNKRLYFLLYFVKKKGKISKKEKNY